MTDDTDLRDEIAALNAKLDKLAGRVDAVAPADPKIEATLQDGPRPDTPAPETGFRDPKTGQPVLSRAQLDALTPEEVARLDETDETLIDRSLAAMGGNRG